ncbi:hypothetical protein NHX12_005158 [Muraenolepis orangiensis]|uniref:Uncharacterized protein n=1 Tax=Muraenolepis orangiensis TaxID=630683 RepID=A0A9Q0DNV0_9TELE|nr:hypothetical protein NHX12_005158 [Muraenolepis orangiensis]
MRALNVRLAVRGGRWQLCGRSGNGVPVTLEGQQQHQLWQLLINFDDCFSWEEALGQIPLVQHSIDTGDAMPIPQRPRRLPLGRQEAAEQALVKM